MDQQDREFILKLAATPSGDILKAGILQAIFPGKFEGLDVGRMKLPPGSVERAFAAAAATKTIKSVPEEAKPVAAPAERMSGSPQTQPKRELTLIGLHEKVDLEQVAVSRDLKPWPNNIAFQDIAKEPPPPEKPKVADDAEFVDIDGAAALRGISKASAYAYAGKFGWERKKAMGPSGLVTLYRRSDVLADGGSASRKGG